MINRLSVVSWGFIAGLFVAAVLAIGGWLLLRRHGHRRRWTVPVLVVAVVLTVTGVATSVNRYFFYLPHLGDVVSVAEGSGYWPTYSALHALPVDAARHRYPDGVVTRLHVPDRGSGFGDHDALAWLPPQYFTSPRRHFPVGYLIHGSPGVPADWFRGGEAATTAAKLARAGNPMIVVAPRMSRTWLDDPECVDGVKEKVETQFLRDVIPTVDHTLRTVPTRRGRLIGGMSAGGYCALNLGLRNRDLFATIVDMSGFTRPTHRGGLAALFGHGPAARAVARANSPDKYAPSLSPHPVTWIWMDCGTGDHEVLPQLRSFSRVLADRGFAVGLHLRPGAHTFHVWAPALAAALAWAAPRLEHAA